jgi:hypothetical protein
LMGEDRGGGAHGVAPPHPALSHQGRGNFFILRIKGQEVIV